MNTPQIQDFWSPQTYNWGQLQIDPQGQLTISAWGMNAYSYDQTVDFNRPTAPVDQLLSFTLAPSIAWKGPVERDGDTGLRFMDGQNLTFWRSDQGSRRVSFGLATPEGAPTWFLKDALGGSPGSLTPEAAVNPDPSSGWLASEGKRVGGLATVFDLPIGGSTWTPVASRDGQVLQLQSVTVEGNRITAQFEDGITGIIGLPGTGTAAAPADTQPLVTVQRLAAWGNGLALYEADPITGAVGGLRPGDPGYLDAALAQAETSGRLVNALQLPAYGTTGSLNGLNLDPSRSYGVLLLVQGDPNRLLCSYAAANPGGAAQMLSLGSDGRGIVIGIEDQQIFGGTTDGDFNDLILRVDAAVVRLV